jgi:hypothetical protein
MVPGTPIDALSLVPVVEFEPGRYRRAERDYPLASTREEPDARQRYWLACLADVGIDDLAPIYPGAWLVSASEIASHATLRRLIEVTLAIHDLEVERLPDALEGLSLHERLSALDGGFVIASRDGPLAEPACCADLGGLAGFRAALEYDDDEWRPIWTGHDGAAVALRRGGLELQIDAVEYELSPGLFAAAIDNASKELDAFEARLSSVAQTMVPEELAAPLARCFVGRSR